jgi:acetyl esterase/lipase
VPSQELLNVIGMLRAQPAGLDRPLTEVREQFEMIAAIMPAAPDVRVEKADAGGVPAEWLTPPEADPSRVLYWLHGGGYCIGSVNTHRGVVSAIARAAGMRALVPDYRLAPEHPFPAALDDAVAAYRWILEQGVAPERTVIGGDSAGGGLTVAALVALRDAGAPLPAAAVLVSPWTDLECAGASIAEKAEVDPMLTREVLLRMAEAYCGGHDPRSPLISPLHADLSSLPPMLIQVGTWEILLDDSLRLAERAKAAGVDVTLETWEEMIHVWHFFAASVPESREAIEAVGRWLRRRVPAAAAREA